jgi:uncharacterized protein YlxW (UPF0749 family)
MQPDALAPLIPIAAIIMFGLVQISKHWRGQPQSRAANKQLEERLGAVEEQLANLQGELSDAQERLDFAERVLAQTQDARRLPPQ